MSVEKSLDSTDDTVDPRVQIELERLNSATDEINRLEVELDEARNHFRQLLAESTIRINNCSKKLGNCIEKARPYYDARIKAKEALQETQKAAVNFERANSAHAAAKEMVYLAEEGLKTEGRTFDHAWQEMLNHATMRVNESEAERTKAETEHKRTSQIYQKAEVRVQRLQKELKKAISKSRPYFELKIHFTQLLEQQKAKVKNLERQVSNVKLSYADTLKNLEQISDEIHKTRQKNNPNGSNDVRDLTLKNSPSLSSAKESNNFQNDEKAETGSSQPDTDMWSENSETGNVEGTGENGVDSSIPSPNSENDSSITEPPDPESEDEFYKFSNRINSFVSNTDLKDIENEIQSRSQKTNVNMFEGIGICSFPVETELNLNFGEEKTQVENSEDQSNTWTEIKLHSPEEEPFPTIKQGKVKNELEEDYDIPYTPLSEMEPEFGFGSRDGSGKKEADDGTDESTQKMKLNSALNNWINKKKDPDRNELEHVKSLKGTPRKVNIRRQSLDVLWNNATGEKMKEIFSQSILKLSIGSLSERRNSESKIGEDSDAFQDVNDVEGLKGNEGSNYESNLTSQFGLQFFTKKNSKPDENSGQTDEKKIQYSQQESFSNQIGGFITRKEKFFTKKVPSPLEKTLGYLNADEDSNSDNESLASNDMLTDEQLASLVLDRDLTEIYQDIVS
ncbi:UNVERIFIED_CONTAM: hypothetical protein PYX00_010343 [Menopon gallinae]|uniref:SH3 domain-binding protein 5 n=1 Tax=Menopon gallinae TaxID=328185 RepID=A0AAW2HF98_9NEOP